MNTKRKLTTAIPRHCAAQNFQTPAFDGQDVAIQTPLITARLRS